MTSQPAHRSQLTRNQNLRLAAAGEDPETVGGAGLTGILPHHVGTGERLAPLTASELLAVFVDGDHVCCLLFVV